MVSLVRWLPGHRGGLPWRRKPLLIKCAPAEWQQDLALNFRIMMVEWAWFILCLVFILFIDSYKIKMAVPVPEFGIIGIGVIYIWFHFCRSWGAGGKGVAGERGSVLWTAAFGRNVPVINCLQGLCKIKKERNAVSGESHQNLKTIPRWTNSESKWPLHLGDKVPAKIFSGPETWFIRNMCVVGRSSLYLAESGLHTDKKQMQMSW